MLHLRLALAASVFATTMLFGLGALEIVGLARARTWPHLESPMFDLVPGAKGAWSPVWPRSPGRMVAQLHLLVEPHVEPAAIDVIVTAVGDACTMHTTGDSIGYVSRWTWAKEGRMPADTSYPLVVEGGLERLEWTVARVGPTARGAKARIVMGEDATRSRLIGIQTRALAVVVLPLLGMLALTVFLCGRRIHARQEKERARNRLQGATVPGGVVVQRSFGKKIFEVVGLVLWSILLLAMLAGGAFAVFVAVQRAQHMVAKLTGWGGKDRVHWQSSSFATVDLVPGAEGAWSPAWIDRPGVRGNALLWLELEDFAEVPEGPPPVVFARVDPPEAAWRFEPGHAAPEGEWRVGLENDHGAAIAIDPRRVRIIHWRVESVPPGWADTLAHLTACGSCEVRQGTNGRLP